MDPLRKEKIPALPAVPPVPFRGRAAGPFLALQEHGKMHRKPEAKPVPAVPPEDGEVLSVGGQHRPPAIDQPAPLLRLPTPAPAPVPLLAPSLEVF